MAKPVDEDGGRAGIGELDGVELARMGYETRQVRFDCPGWQCDGEEFHLAGRRLPAGAQFYGSMGKEARVVIGARQTQSSTGNVSGQKGPAIGPVLMVCAHHEALPASPGAYDNTSGIGVVLDMAQRFSKA